MGVREVAAAHYRQQAALARRVAEKVGRLWRRVSPQDIAGSWRAQLPEAFAAVTLGQLDAAEAAPSYLADVAGGRAGEAISPLAFAGLASDGRDLESLLYQPAITALTTIGRGSDVRRSLAAGAVELDMIVRTQVADAGRVADGVATTASRHVDGYIRMLTLPSCSRCIILAGVFYEWNAGFLRHPRCDCRHIPASEDLDEELLTNPQAVFDAMPKPEQDKVFTAAGAQAIRDGADMVTVVNARRGANGLTPAGARLTAEEATILRGGRKVGRLTPVDVFGKPAFVTTEGTTIRGGFGRSRRTGPLNRRGKQSIRSTTATRLMPEQIYLDARGDRDEAIRLLRLHGYLTGEPRRPAPRPEPVAEVSEQETPASAKVDGRDILADETRRWNDDRDGFDELVKRQRGVPYDTTLADLGSRQGFDGVPVVASRDELDAAVAQGWTEVWRGVAGLGPVTAAQINARFRTGEYEPGRGIYGNGWYASERRMSAETYRHREPKTNFPAGGGADFESSDLVGPELPDSMLRMAISPQARVIDYDELVALSRAWSIEHPKGNAALLFADHGRFAAALGYDAIRIGGRHSDGAFYPGWEDAEDDMGGAVQYVILNRTAVMVQRAEDVP